MPSKAYIIEVNGVEVHRVYDRMSAYGMMKFVSGSTVRTMSLVEKSQ